MKVLINTDVMIGTLEMASEACCKDFSWRTKLIVVDEAGQATEALTLIPLQFADRDGHIVLIGDHMQLAPTVFSDAANYQGLGTSMFERLTRVGGIDTCMLTIQYRMHHSICSWPSQEFYEGKVVTDISLDNREKVKGFPWPKQSALAFLNIRGNEDVSDEQSVSNDVEAKLAIIIVKLLLHGKSVQERDIAIMTPYSAQSKLIKSLLKKATLQNVEVPNIDAFQGREKEVIVLSLVRSNANHQLGFLDDMRRINVGLTRAKRGLAVIGDKDTLKYGYESGLTSFIRNVYERGLVIEMPRDQQRAAAFLHNDAKQVVMNIHDAKLIAKNIDVQKSTKRQKKLCQLKRLGFRWRIVVIFPP